MTRRRAELKGTLDRPPAREWLEALEGGDGNLFFFCFGFVI